MRNPRLSPTLLAATLFASVPIQADAREATSATHCTDAEQTLFSCSTGRKRVSVCASTDLARDDGFVQYRFGEPRHAEIVLPSAGHAWRAATHGGVLTFSGGGGAYLAFASPPYRYVVYSAIGQGWGSRAGVVVEKQGRRVASLPCVGEAESRLGPDLFERGGIAEDALGFELPPRPSRAR